ncbi:MAG: RluA family pseudouridine synthase [Desulfopila sp.]
MKNRKSSPYPSTRKTSDTLIVAADGPLLAYLISALPGRSRNRLKAVLKARQILVDGRPIGQFDHPLRQGQKVEVQWQRNSQPVPMQGLTIVHEDPDIIVVNKPANLLTVATDKEKRRTAYAILSSYVKSEHPDNRIFIVHRLDRETSGLLLFARNEKTKRLLQESWETTIRQRSYVAVVVGEITEEEGTVTSWLTESRALKVYSSQNPGQGQKAITHFRKLRASSAYTLLQLNLDTGRKHQIRVHMQDIGHPVAGDRKYGTSTEKPINRLALHAQTLVFTHPVTDRLCHFTTPVPPLFVKLFASP